MNENEIPASQNLWNATNVELRETTVSPILERKAQIIDFRSYLMKVEEEDNIQLKQRGGKSKLKGKQNTENKRLSINPEMVPKDS